MGASFDGLGVNFAVFSRAAARVELCLYASASAAGETERIELLERTDHVWHCYVPDLKPGQLYGYRVHGPYDPSRGHRFNPNKVLLDPYSKLVARDVAWDDSMFGYRLGDSRGDLAPDPADNGAFAPLAAVADAAFDWGEDAPPRTPWHETVIYELHVKGFTKLHPDLPERLRGTYAGLGTEPVIKHLKELGVTALELLPVHHHVDDRHLVERGLTNYWGYNTLSFFAPDRRYASRPERAVSEFKEMVKNLHAAGLEVVLDVVYNHTAEGSHLGPTLSLRGFDNEAYYRLAPGNPRYYEDFTGCGNSLDMREPRALQLVMDSLRYWVEEMRVDGFRFDLASTLAREEHDVDGRGGFFDAVLQDPVLSRVKLIAEPWDLGHGGYQVGNFPPGWAEWNGRYRDSVRSFWKGEPGGLSELATRLTGSSDLYERSGRKPHASVNFITCHDGFTLQDLVSYDVKHNEANGEDNRDGTDDNRSWNCGAEGPSDDPAVVELRERQKRNLLSTLLLSQGVPMLCAGDEFSRTQMGNNNAYCQDNELSWVSWTLDARQREFLEFVKSLLALRRGQAVLKRRNFFRGRAVRGARDIVWLAPGGREMTEDAWRDPAGRSLVMRLSGDALDEADEKGRPVAGDTLLVLINAGHEPKEFESAPPRPDGAWEALVETAPPSRNGAGPGHWSWELTGRTVAVFRLEDGGRARHVEAGEAGERVLEAARAAVRRVLERSVRPLSTYRLQLRPGFGFDEAAGLIPYFAALGVDALYLSPILKAAPGSAHGYDVVDPTRINPELGGEPGFERLAWAAREAGLKLVLDVVPNHMGVEGGHNALWRDVLERGQDSQYARFFDVDWSPAKRELKGKVLLPVLGDLYGRVLAKGEIKLARADGRFELEVYGVRYPVSARSYPVVLEHGIEELERSAPGDLLEYRAISALAGGGDAAGAVRRLEALTRRSPAVAAHLEARLALFNGDGPRRADLVDALLARQHYRLAYWRAASDEINYRRFFNVNELAAVRVELESVFDHTHRLILRLACEGAVQGLRIDHSDGLYDPAAYFRRLQERFIRQSIPPAEASSSAVARVLEEPEFASAAPLWVVAEKVLDVTESPREDWRIHGTVGYDALNQLNGVFVDHSSEAAMDAVYEAFIGHKIEVPRLLRDSKRRFIRAQMSSEIESLGHRLDDISEASRDYRDFTRAGLTAALREVVDCFPVYRTYITPLAERVDERDELYIRQACEDAKRANPRIQPDVYDFVRDVLLLKLEDGLPPEQRALYRDFVLRFQQLTGSVMAKGVEDTAFYVDNRLLSLNEVGGDPARFGCPLEAFHLASIRRAKRWPWAMTATSTHDTKRSEDVRTRLDALSEIPADWGKAVAEWAVLNAGLKSEVAGTLEPRPNTEWFIYQTLVGLWPDGTPDRAGRESLTRRLLEYVLKSVREAKVRTDWTNPNQEYESAVQAFAGALAAAPEDSPFMRSFLPFQRRVSWLGKLSSLSCLALKLGGPGVPDTFQGCELWDYSLVDPDNRRPVDWAARRAALEALGERPDVRALLERPENGRVKLFVLNRFLRARRRLPELFARGAYRPLETAGGRADQLVAFARTSGSSAAVVAAGRFFSRFPEMSMPLGEAWGDAALLVPDDLASKSFVDALTGEPLAVESVDGRPALRAASLFARLPLCLGVTP